MSTFDNATFPAHFKLAMKLLRKLFDCDLDEMKKRYDEAMMMMIRTTTPFLLFFLKGIASYPFLSLFVNYTSLNEQIFRVLGLLTANSEIIGAFGGPGFNIGGRKEREFSSSRITGDFAAAGVELHSRGTAG